MSVLAGLALSALVAWAGLLLFRGDFWRADQRFDDCALAAAIKPQESIWLGLAERETSPRPYDRLGDVWDMVARSAFEQLNRSWLALVGTILGMVVLYVVPPLAALYGVASGDAGAALAGAGGWGLMAVGYRPTVRLYDLPAWIALTLPLAGLLYAAMTADSARRHGQGRGGGWKGRSYSYGLIRTGLFVGAYS